MSKVKVNGKPRSKKDHRMPGGISSMRRFLSLQSGQSYSVSGVPINVVDKPTNICPPFNSSILNPFFPTN